jgi:RimJ/RimL family protein N-acetyltransferase
VAHAPTSLLAPPRPRRLILPTIVDVGASDVIAETDRLILRPWRLDEADRFFDMHRRMEVAQWIGGRPMADPSEAEPLIQRMLERLAADPRFGAWAVVERATGIPAGTALLKPLPDGAGEIEIGWHFHPDSWGRGLASEAARALLARGFALGLAEIWAVTDPLNQRSVRVCEKLGMRLLGTTHRWYHELSLMFWIGMREGQQPTTGPDGSSPGLQLD